MSDRCQGFGPLHLVPEARLARTCLRSRDGTRILVTDNNLGDSRLEAEILAKYADCRANRSAFMDGPNPLA